MMNDSDIRWERFGALSGLAALVLSAVGFAVAPFPPTIGAPIEEITGYFTANHQGVLLQSYVLLLGSAALLWFVFVLYGFLSRSEDQPGRLSVAVAGCGIMGITLGVFSTMIPAVLALQTDSALDPATFKAVLDVGSILTPISNVPFGLMVLAVGLVVLRKAPLPAWFGWCSVVLGVLNVATASAYMFGDGPMATGGVLSNLVGGLFALWLLAAVAMVYRRLSMRDVSANGASV